MNREIKFRGFSLDIGNWVYGYAIFNSDKTYANICNKTWNNEMQMWAVIPETVGEYTGLKDKNGKDIYEGDIVQGFRSAMATDGKVRKKYPQNVRVFLEVKWSDGKNYDCGFYLKEIKYHPADKEATNYNQYRRIQYCLQESRDPHLIDNEIIPWHGKSEYVEVIGNIYENPKLLK